MSDHDATTPFPPLEEECAECNGKGHYENWSECFVCDGKGSVPTEFGRAVLEFVRSRITFKIGD